jgi:hypothetical protein
MIESLAATVIQGMQNASSGQYNALHLRIEKDARDWSTIMGGKQVLRLRVCCFLLAIFWARALMRRESEHCI